MKKLMLYDNSIGDEAMAELRRACECSSTKISFLFSQYPARGGATYYIR